MTETNSKFTIEQQMVGLMQRMRGLRLGDFPKGHLDLSYSQIELVWFVSKNPGCHLQEVADGIDLTPPTVSVSIRRLEESGWIERRSDPNDGRATCLYLTRKGEEAIRKFASAQTKNVRFFLNQLSENEQHQLLGLMEKAISGVELMLQEQNITAS